MIRVTFEGECIIQIQQQCRAFLTNTHIEVLSAIPLIHAPVVAPVPVIVPPLPPPTVKRASKTRIVVPDPVVLIVEETPAVVKVPDIPLVVKPVETHDGLFVEDLRVVAAKICAKYGRAGLLPILATYEVIKASDVEGAKWRDFVTECETLLTKEGV